MAGKSLAAMERYLNCHICSQTFRDPVSLGCHHSFCSRCLKTFWDQAKNKNCPLCATPEGKEARLSADKVKFPSGESKEEVVCSKHREEPKWFCEEEQRAVCHVCEFPAHNNHKLVPLEQAVNNLKDKLNSDLESLQDKKDKYTDVEGTYKDVMKHSKKQLVATEKQIKLEFEKLHQFLSEEEEARLTALREEEEQKGKTVSREMKIIQDQLSSLTASISAVEQDLQKQTLSFLTSYKCTQTSTRAQVTLPDAQLVSGVLIDVAKHLGNLSFRVWEEMKRMVKFTPVILDPNTADRCLSLSDDLTSVGQHGSEQQLPDNPERLTEYTSVVGSEGFSSGKHSWEVEVGDHPHWNIGVARESVDRNRELRAPIKKGVWSIVRRRGKYTNGFGVTLPLKRRLQRIRIQLDCDRGEVSFYDPEDMTHIYTYKDTFTEKLYPYFNIGNAGDAKYPDVRILPSELPVLSKDHLHVNGSLKELVDPCAEPGRKMARHSEDKVGPSGEEREEEPLSKEGREEVEVVCTKHTEEPKWFCEVEQRAVCHICESPENHNHKLVPLDKAVNNLKEKLESDLESLQDKKDKYEDVEETYKEVVQHSKKQLVATEKQIKLEFKKLYQFLSEEEEARLTALREEEEQKGKTVSREMKIIQDQLSSLTASISAVEQDLQKQTLSFLTSYKHTQTSTRAQVTLPDPQLVSGVLIDVAKHLGNLSFRVWEEMKRMVTFTPVILDPNTAHTRLSLSDDLTSVGQHGPEQQLPDNPERLTEYTSVLGSEGFSSGKHSWEVEVGDHPRWNIGVARESVDRKGKQYASPEYGNWCIQKRSSKYTNGFGETLTLKRIPQRIGVQLDCDRGKVYFYDPEDMTHIYTQKDTFTEKLYPHFNIGDAGDAKYPDVKIKHLDLKILQSELPDLSIKEANKALQWIQHLRNKK